ncbi:MAG: hypothetical protein FJW29_11900 [Acidobacteria bacterium]|nr:hypothetical protein [Acidobacteriota bacterium]
MKSRFYSPGLAAAAALALVGGWLAAQPAAQSQAPAPVAIPMQGGSVQQGTRGTTGYPAAKTGGNYMHNFYFPPAVSSTPWWPDWAPDGARRELVQVIATPASDVEDAAARRESQGFDHGGVNGCVEVPCHRRIHCTSVCCDRRWLGLARL